MADDRSETPEPTAVQEELRRLRDGRKLEIGRSVAGVALGEDELATEAPARGLWGNAFRQLLRKKSAVVGLFMLVVLLILAVFAPLLAPHDPNGVLLSTGVQTRAGPSGDHWLGIDGNGRDVLSRLIYGSRVSLLAGVVSVGFAVIVGSIIGIAAGFFGKWVDTVLMRFMDVLLAFPSLLLAIFVVTVFGPGLINAILAISIVSIPIYARVVRSSVLSIRDADFVKADVVLGVSTFRLITHRIVPNSLTPLTVQATLGVATAVLEVAALSFLGLGVQPPTAEWGSMLAAERNQVFTAPHLVFFPGFAIMWNVLAFNLLGDGLRDALDPRLNR